MDTIEIFSREDFAAIRTQWLAHLGPERKNSTWPLNALLYTLIKGKNPRKAFSPIKNPARLERVAREHRADAWKSLDDAALHLKNSLKNIQYIRAVKAGFTEARGFMDGFYKKQPSQLKFGTYEFNLSDAQIEYLLAKIEGIKFINNSL